MKTPTTVAHWLAATAFGLALSPACATVQARGARLAYDSTLNVTWARDTYLFDTVAAQMGGTQALKAAIARDVFEVREMPNATHASDRRDAATGSWYQFLDYTVVDGVTTYTDFSVDLAGHTTMNWYAQNAFVSYLNLIAYEGSTTWRLPSMIATGSQCLLNMQVGGACPDSQDNNEVQSLMYSLGMQNNGMPWSSQSSSPLYFAGLRNGRYYWLSGEMRRFTMSGQGEIIYTTPADWYLAMASEHGPTTDRYGVRTVANGVVLAKTDYNYFITLHDGDVVAATVPEPSTWALWLCGMGLVGWRARTLRTDRAERTAARLA